MKNAECKRCLNKFNQKDIYTIQQFQYRKSPSYEWTKEFFSILKIGEWDSFCEACLHHYAKISNDAWLKYCKN
ncbi:hypothetical protein [Candidatus Nitrosotenuis sp. DW1]|uniref:hypothetical protein n=1 Tax=Candidatus Nitrosotenuis sp. DW1 TaxID=2259672 RepID=UPI0015C95053|nr:hypothetical protein [Candidatus Nitrosotenuis sp. DW1]QLH08889.1 hypothetical protein DSQ19_04780 [Candidatus Nitrosotenuis sp. DW1]